MNYEIQKKQSSIVVGVEATFTLIDFLLFFSSFLLGFVVGFFFLIFAVAILQKIFARYEFEFNTDTYEIIKYYRFFSYFRFRQQKISFGEVDQILLSNYDSGPVLFGKGMKKQEWFTLDIKQKNNIVRISKADHDELDDVYQLHQDLKEHLDLYFIFNIEFVDVERD